MAEIIYSMASAMVKDYYDGNVPKFVAEKFMERIVYYNDLNDVWMAISTVAEREIKNNAPHACSVRLYLSRIYERRALGTPPFSECSVCLDPLGLHTTHTCDTCRNSTHEDCLINAATYATPGKFCCPLCRGKKRIYLNL